MPTMKPLKNGRLKCEYFLYWRVTIEHAKTDCSARSILFRQKESFYANSNTKICCVSEPAKQLSFKDCGFPTFSESRILLSCQLGFEKDESYESFARKLCSNQNCSQRRKHVLDCPWFNYHWKQYGGLFPVNRNQMEVIHLFGLHKELIMQHLLVASHSARR